MRGIWPATARCRLLRGLTARVAVALAVLLICGLLAATLVRMAPGFGMDERMLDVRRSSGSLRAMERQGAEQSDILHYYRSEERRVGKECRSRLSTYRPKK